MSEPTHYHCPYGHEHPQPCKLEDGRVICRKCLYDDGVEVECILCTPETCGERA
jgi:hypothetical protein